MERRRSARFQRRAPVSLTFSGSEAISGFMTNISATGAYVQASRALTPKTRVRLQIRDGAKSWAFEGLVVSKRDVNPSLRVVEQPGMGIRFLRPDELLDEVVPRPGAVTASASAPVVVKTASSTAGIEPVVVDLTQLSAFEAAAADVRAGGMKVKSDRIVELNSMIPLSIRLPGVPEPLRVDARIVLLADRGFAVQFASADAVRSAFAEVALRWNA